MKQHNVQVPLDISVGHHQHYRDSRWIRRLTNQWGLLYSKSGSGVISLGNENFSVPHHAILLYKPGYAYTFTSVKSWNYIWLHFPVRSNILDSLTFPEVIPGLGCFTPGSEELAKILGNLNEIHYIERFHKPNWEDLALNLIENILYRLCLYDRNSVSLPEKSLDAALQMLISNDCPPIEELAGSCGVSVSSFYNIFSRELGCSPRAYREQYQIRNARRLLLNSSLSIDEIAARCGFCNRYYMSERFKKLLGITPGALRKNSRKTL